MGYEQDVRAAQTLEELKEVMIEMAKEIDDLDIFKLEDRIDDVEHRLNNI